MEELREYLNRMFENVPESPEILRTKAELLQMMEDKYDGLMMEGLNAEEAKKTVIDEFGNFDEIIKELDIETTDNTSSSGNKAEETQEQASTQDTGNTAGAAFVAGAAAGVAGTAFGAGAAAGSADGAEGTNGSTGGASTGNGSTFGPGGPNAQNFGPETEKNRQKGEYDERYKKKYRNYYHWGANEIKAYFSFATRHAFMVAGAVAMCILAPYFTSVIDDIGRHVATGKVGGALSTLMFFTCIAAAIALFISASRSTSRYGTINKDAVFIDPMAQPELKSHIARLESARTVQLVIGIILCVLGPAASSFADILPSILREIFGPSVLLFAAIGVFLIIFSSSTGNRVKELDRGMRRFEKYRDDFPDAAGADIATSWNYEAKSGMPVVLIVILVLFAGLAIKTGINIVRGVGIWSGSFWGMSDGKNYDGVEKYSLSNVDSIYIDLSSSDVVIEETAGDEVTCEYHGRFTSQPQISLDNGSRKVNITEEDGIHLFTWGSNDGVVTVHVPKSKTISYDLDTSSGNIKMNGVNAKELKVDVSSGDLAISNTTVEEKTELDTSSGDVLLSNFVPKDMKVDMSSGDFILRFADKTLADKYRFDLDTSSGDIHFMGSEMSDEAKIEAKDTSDPHTIVIDTSSGDITIE